MAVCDLGGNLIALQRMDGCMPIGAEIATEKARSAILFARVPRRSALFFIRDGVLSRGHIDVLT